jgi:YD repeat-containing protein
MPSASAVALQVDFPAGTFGLGYCAWNGKLAAVTNGNGMVASYAYDVMDRVTNIAWTAANGTALGGFSYEYDAAGRIVSRTHSLGNSSQPSQLSQSSHKTYAYDGLGRLATDGDVAYAYDAAGNRMARTENGEAHGERRDDDIHPRCRRPPRLVDGRIVHLQCGGVRDSHRARRQAHARPDVERPVPARVCLDQRRVRGRIRLRRLGTAYLYDDA